MTHDVCRGPDTVCEPLQSQDETDVEDRDPSRPQDEQHSHDGTAGHRRDGERGQDREDTRQRDQGRAEGQATKLGDEQTGDDYETAASVPVESDAERQDEAWHDGVDVVFIHSYVDHFR